ncbi:thioesterase family protein [Mycolicibacterium sp. XJ870]
MTESKASLSLIVTDELTAAASGNPGVVVFSTPQLILLLENACVAAVQDRLAPGQVTLGINLDVAHLAASPVGSRITAEATLVHESEKILDFEVAAFDDLDEVAKGTHRRAIVSRDRFLHRVREKAVRVSELPDAERRAEHRFQQR